MSTDTGLEVADLTVRGVRSTEPLVRGISFAVRPGETVALVGESGSGKSLTAKAIAGLLPRGLAASGSIVWHGEELMDVGEARLRAIRGREITMLLQDPFTLLNPLSPVLRSLTETPAKDTPQRRLSEVGLDLARVARRFPWELSGGMRQRIGIAAAIGQRPRLLIGDESTTALDATTQREVLRLLRMLQRSHHMAMLLITHDLRVAMAMSDRLLVMSDGAIVEEATPSELRAGARVAYTRRLLAAELPTDRRVADLAAPAQGGAVKPSSPTGETIIRVSGLSKRFGGRSSGDVPWALRDVSLEVVAGRCVGVIGESGSGKTTLARCLLQLEQPSEGTIELLGSEGVPLSQAEIQCVFQDPYSSLNPAHTIGFTLREALRRRGADVADPDGEIDAMLARVGLPTTILTKRPEALSGGQRQRIAIARALLMKPRVLVCDEPVAALDLTVQSQVLQLLRDVQAGGVALVFITHDMSVARQMADDVVVLFQGSVVERGATDDVLSRPQQEYTRELLSAVPVADQSWLAEDGAA